MRALERARDGDQSTVRDLHRQKRGAAPAAFASRETLETLTSDWWSARWTLRQAIDDAKLGIDEIEDVILVGGMTRMPAIQKAVAEFFRREPNKSVHPDEVVALGASIQGAALVQEKHEMILLDVTPHALGIMTFGSYFEELIPQNTTVRPAAPRSSRPAATIRPR